MPFCAAGAAVRETSGRRFRQTTRGFSVCSSTRSPVACELPSVHLNELPRMADFAEWGEAVGRALGWGPERFVRSVRRQPQTGNRPAARRFNSGDAAIRACVKLGPTGPARPRRFLTRPRQPLKAISVLTGQKALLPSAELRRIAPQLRLHGIAIHFERRREGTIVSLSVENGKTVGSNPNITNL